MIYIIRHGQTHMNKAKRMQGRSEHPLNDTGIEQARELGKQFADRGIIFDIVISSPLQRAIDTASIVSGKPVSEIIIDERLTEMDYGPYEGMELTNPAPEVIEFFKDFANVPAPDGMEQLGMVVARLGAFAESIKDKAADLNILVSTHAIAMKGLLEYLTPNSHGSYWSKYIGNCEVYTSEIADGEYTTPEEWQR